jgi:hypothetical protein
MEITGGPQGSKKTQLKDDEQLLCVLCRRCATLFLHTLGERFIHRCKEGADRIDNTEFVRVQIIAAADSDRAHR